MLTGQKKQTVTSTPTKSRNQTALAAKPVTTVSLSAGLAALDEDPIYYFGRFAGNYFEILEDLEAARLNREAAEHIAFLEYFAYLWLVMAKSQAEKYGHLIIQHKNGRELLERLALASAYQDVPAIRKT